MNKQTKDKKLMQTIEDTRVILSNLISDKQYNLLDSKVIELSELLDKLLSQYHNLKK